MKYTRRCNCWGQQQHFEYKSWACHVSIKAGFSTTSLNFCLIIVINWNEVSTFSGMMNNTTWENCFRAFIRIITLQDFTHRLNTWNHLVCAKENVIYMKKLSLNIEGISSSYEAEQVTKLCFQTIAHPTMLSQQIRVTSL